MTEPKDNILKSFRAARTAQAQRTASAAERNNSVEERVLALVKPLTDAVEAIAAEVRDDDAGYQVTWSKHFTRTNHNVVIKAERSDKRAWTANVAIADTGLVTIFWDGAKSTQCGSEDQVSDAAADLAHRLGKYFG